MSDSSGSLREQLSVLNRHRWKMVGFFIGTMLLVTLGVIFFPRTYESQAKLHVLLGRESIALDPTATTGQVINMLETREHEINTVKDLLSSRTILEQVVEKLGAETILHPKRSGKSDQPSGPSWMDTVHGWMLKVNLEDPVSNNEKAVKRLAKDIKIHSEPKSNVIDVICRSATPGVAQKIATEYLASYHAQHGRAHRTHGSQDFFSKQSELLASELKEAEQRLRDAKSANGIVTVASNQLTLSKEIELVEMDLLVTSAAIATSQAKIKALIASLEQIPDRLVVEEIAESSYAADEMRKTLYELQIQERALTAKHTDEHPLVVAIREQVGASQKVLDAEKKQRIQPTRSLNPASQQQKLALLAEQTVVSGLEARHKSLGSQFAGLQDKLKQLNEQEIVIAQLERTVSLLRVDYMAYTRNRELARIDQELDSQSISNVNIVQLPSFVEKPASPPKAILMVLGLVLATGGAVALALLSESLGDSMKTTKEVEAALDVPVLESIPQMQSAGLVAK